MRWWVFGMRMQVLIAGTPYGVRGWGRLCPRVAARWPYPALL